MADFCQQCLKKMFNLDTRDLAGLSTDKDTKKGRYAKALCEHCGFILVDHTGKRIRTLLNARQVKRELERLEALRTKKGSKARGHKASRQR